MNLAVTELERQRQGEEKPIFSYKESAIGERLKSSLAPIIALLLFNALFLVSGYIIFLRSSVK
jgi:hypothetical protein